MNIGTEVNEIEYTQSRIANTKSFIFIVGSSGSGKSTLAKKLCDKFNWSEVQSYTTRKPRFPNETGHKFIKPISLSTAQKKYQIALSAKYDGELYFSTFYQLAKNDICVVNPSALLDSLNNNLPDKLHKKIVIINVKCPTLVRVWRMLRRGNDIHQIVQRLRSERKEYALVKQLATFSINTAWRKSYDKAISFVHKEAILGNQN